MAMPFTSTNDLADPIPGFYAAFVRTADARAALAPADFLPINLDIPSTVTAVMTAVARLKAFRADIVAQLPKFDVAQVDALESYAGALAYAHTAFIGASADPAPDLPALHERAFRMREQFLMDANTLAHRGILDPKSLTELKGGTGYLAVAFDLGSLVRIIRARWKDVASKSAIQSAELDEAESLYEQITRAVSDRALQSTNAAVPSEDRQRAFTLLLKSYDEVRRAMQYVRWHHGDAEKIAPSLWAGRGGRGSSESKSANGEKPGGTTPPVAPVEPENEPTKPVAPVDPGMPGGSPFDNN